jgi:hypothetical protein
MYQDAGGMKENWTLRVMKKNTPTGQLPAAECAAADSKSGHARMCAGPNCEIIF